MIEYSDKGVAVGKTKQKRGDACGTIYFSFIWLLHFDKSKETKSDTKKPPPSKVTAFSKH